MFKNTVEEKSRNGDGVPDGRGRGTTVLKRRRKFPFNFYFGQRPWITRTLLFIFDSFDVARATGDNLGGRLKGGKLVPRYG